MLFPLIFFRKMYNFLLKPQHNSLLKTHQFRAFPGGSVVKSLHLHFQSTAYARLCAENSAQKQGPSLPSWRYTEGSLTASVKW